MVVILQQVGAHHGREGQRHETGDHDRAGQRHGELAEEGPGQTALESNGRVDGGERNGHGNDRTDQFPRPEQGGIHGRLTLADVALDVFHHDDGVIHHDAHREHDREQREQVDGETKGHHEGERADQGERHGDDRDEHRAQ